ncbi:MAG: hypothetical protein JWN22_1254 [Nocardioides sp.]|nr:hypothetical protein [Nocardioides sp.]
MNHFWDERMERVLCASRGLAFVTASEPVTCPECLTRLGPSDDGRIDLGAPDSAPVDSGATNTLEGPQNIEGTDVLVRFLIELQRATSDGARKRQAGAKPPWYRDDSHEVAVFSHLTKWKRGELVDPDSGAHPLVHAAWRCLAIACRESGNIPDGDTP